MKRSNCGMRSNLKLRVLNSSMADPIGQVVDFFTDPKRLNLISEDKRKVALGRGNIGSMSVTMSSPGVVRGILVYREEGEFVDRIKEELSSQTVEVLNGSLVFRIDLEEYHNAQDCEVYLQTETTETIMVPGNSDPESFAREKWWGKMTPWKKSLLLDDDIISGVEKN